MLLRGGASICHSHLLPAEDESLLRGRDSFLLFYAFLDPLHLHGDDNEPEISIFLCSRSIILLWRHTGKHLQTIQSVISKDRSQMLLRYQTQDLLQHVY